MAAKLLRWRRGSILYAYPFFFERECLVLDAVYLPFHVLQVTTMFHLDRPMYLLGYLANQSRVYLIDKEFK